MKIDPKTINVDPFRVTLGDKEVLLSDKIEFDGYFYYSGHYVNNPPEDPDLLVLEKPDLAVFILC